MKELFQVTTSTACFGIVVEDGIVIECAPYGRRMLLGKTMTYVQYWVSRSKSKLEFVKGERVKIQLKISPPVEARHGLTEGKVVEVTRMRGPQDTSPAYWFVQGDGEEVGILYHEAEVITSDDPAQESK